MDQYTFDDLLDTPNRKDIEKELAGKLTEVLVPIIVSHPDSMKDVILDYTKRMLGKKEIITQKSEALLKLDSKNDDGESYVPGSLQKVNPIAVPGYLKDNERLKEIAEEGNLQNESDKQVKCDLVRKMTQAVNEGKMVATQ